MLTKYTNIYLIAKLKKFAKLIWFENYFDKLFEEFSKIKFYITRNWPRGSRLETAAGAQVSRSQNRRVLVERQSSLSAEFQKLREQRKLLERQAPVKVDYPISQEKSILFLQERDKYISLLQQVITCARKSSALCSLYLPTQVLLLTEPEITSKQLSQQRALLEKQASFITKQ